MEIPIDENASIGSPSLTKLLSRSIITKKNL